MRTQRWVAAARRVMAPVRAHPEALTALLCLLVIALDVRGPDLAAQDFRTWVYRTHGAVIWNDQWYGGHSLAGYSMLFPPLAALLGARLVGALGCILSTAALARLVRRGTSAGHDVALLWFAIVTVVDLLVGRLPFALGLGLGLAALAAARERRPIVATLLAVLCGAASPLAGAFLLLAALAWLPAAGWRVVRPLAGAGVALVFAALVGEGGRFPFPARTLFTVLLFVGLGLLLALRESSVLRRGLILYGAAAVLLFLVPNPVGGNIVRLGAIVAGPVAAFELVRTQRRRALALLSVPLLGWQLAPVPAALALGSQDLSSRPAYYTGLVAYLEAHGEPIGRIEVPMTRGRWESDFLAAQVPLARGWERQVDVARNDVLYAAGLSAATYRSWLLREGVRWVALPDVPLDSASLQEAALLRSGPAYLHRVWSDRHWTLWEVAAARPLASGATLAELDVSAFRLWFDQAGTAVVRLRWTRFWTVPSGGACVAPDPNGWTTVRSPSPGVVTVSARLGLGSLAGGDSGGSCGPLASDPR